MRKPPIEVELLEPVEFLPGELVHKIALQEPTGETMWEQRPIIGDAYTMPIGWWLELASRVSIYPPAFYKKLGCLDINQVIGALAVQMGPTSATGERASPPSPATSGSRPSSS